MANPIRGEVPMEANGQVYTLVFDFNAICSVEDIFDAPISAIGEKLATGMRAKDLRSLITAGLQQCHPGLTELEAGDVIAIVGAQDAANKLAEAMQAAFPQSKEAAEGKANPPMNRQQRRTSQAS